MQNKLKLYWHFLKSILIKNYNSVLNKLYKPNILVYSKNMTIIWINPFCKFIMVFEYFQWNLAQEFWTVILISSCIGCLRLIETPKYTEKPKYTEIHTNIQLYYIKLGYMMIGTDDSGYCLKNIMRQQIRLYVVCFWTWIMCKYSW